MQQTAIYETSNVKPDARQNGGHTLLYVYENETHVRLVVKGFHYNRDVELSDETVPVAAWRTAEPYLKNPYTRKIFPRE